MSALHPRTRLPLWAALVLPAAAYLYRSMSRGFDFRPDMPYDAIALAAFAIVFGAVAWSRRTAAQERHEQPTDEQDGEDGDSGDERKDDDVVSDVE